MTREPICADELKLREIPSLPRLQEPRPQDSNRSRNDAGSINPGIEDSLYCVVRTASAAVAEDADLFGLGLA